MAVYNASGAEISRLYDASGSLIPTVYDINGNIVTGGHAVSSRYTRTQMFDLTGSIPTGTQGIACDSITQTIAQLYTGTVVLIDATDGSSSSGSTINLGHGHSGQFAPTKSENDDYPLLYVSGPYSTVDDTEYTFLLVVKCTTSSATMKKVIAVPKISSDYASGRVVVDFENSIVYHIQSTSYAGPADNMYITVWDMNTESELSGATYSPNPQDGIYVLTRKLSEFSIPHIPEMQACTFFDGMIVALSDVSGNKGIFFVDVETEDVYMTIRNFGMSGELEGVDFLYNSITEQYDMIVSQRTADYYRFQFDLG